MNVRDTADSASTPSGRTLLGPEPKRPSTGLISSGIRMSVTVTHYARAASAGAPQLCASGFGQHGPAIDVLRLARRGTDVAQAGPQDPAEPLLLEDVRAPAGHPRAGEHRREHLRRDLGEVEHDRRPELDVGG